MVLSMYRYLSALLLTAAFAQSNYHQLKKISIGGEGGWDYLIADASSGRVYVSHGTEVDVVDTKTGAVACKITGLHGVHGIALAPEGVDSSVTDNPAPSPSST
jgi:hypothetical protein